MRQAPRIWCSRSTTRRRAARREQLARAVEVLRRHRAEETPVVIARALGAEEESVAVTTLGSLADPDTGELDAVDMRTLLIVGSSTTRTIPGVRVNDDAAHVQASNGAPPRVYTPRRYPA